MSAKFPGHRDVVFCVAWHPDGERIASLGGERRQFTVKVWKPQDQRDQGEFSLPVGLEYPAAAFSPDGNYLVTGRAERKRASLGRAGRAGSASSAPTTDGPGVVFSPDGRPILGFGERRRGGQTVGCDPARRD